MSRHITAGPRFLGAAEPARTPAPLLPAVPVVECETGPAGAEILTATLPCGRVLSHAILEPRSLDAEAVAAIRAWGARVCDRCLAARGGACPSRAPAPPRPLHLVRGGAPRVTSR